MRFLHPAGAWALLLAIPIIALHVLRPNRMRRVVSSIVLWKRQTFTLSATSPWQRLVPSRLLMLQLLGVALFALTLTSPVRLTHAPVARHTVFIIDVSGSMEARDGSPTRLATAKTRARALRDQLPDGGVATIVTAGPQPRLALTTESARAPFDSTLASLATASGPTDWPTAFALAQSVDTPATPTVYVLISDGAMSAVDQKAIPVGTSWVRVGRRAMNRSVSRISVEVRNGGLRAVAAVRSTGGPRATQRLRFVVDGRTVATQRVTVGSGATTEAVANIPAGDRVVAVLEGGDLLAGDDTAYAVGATRRELQVLVAGPDDVFLRRLLDALPGVNVERTTNPATPTAGFDLAVYNEVPVPARPTVPFIAIASPGAVPGAGVRTTAEVAQPAVTLVRSDLPLLSGIDLSAVGIATSQKLVLDAGTSAEPLVSSDATPLIVRGTANNQPFVYFGFALADTNLPLQVAFPLLGDRLVRELGGTATVQPELHVGDLLPVPARAATVIAPSGRRQALVAGSATPTADQPGFWVVREKDRPDRILAVNADPSESSIEPATTLPIAFAKAAEEVPFEAQRSLRSWLIGAILVLLFFEWREGRRTRGVSARQWRGAMVLRALAVSCLVLALIGVSLPRRGRSVAVLFAIDASDSVSPVAAAAANDWVRDAMAFAPKGGKAGVLVFGSDARIESLVAARPSAPALPFRAKIDSTGTNIAAALRLASAVLPRDTKRRVVVVSDGRSTDGDAIDAAARLRREGIAVDVWPVARQTGADAAIDSLEVPTKIRTGESFAVKVVVAATAPGPAVIEFRRGSGLIAQRRVVLQTGSNTIVFDGQPGGNPGVARFEATVRTDGDLVSANDRGFAAATIDGPPRVLVVEGTPGEGGRLVAALRSQQLVVDVVAPGQLPPLEQLSGYGATVLVDVDARTLAAEQVVSLDAASRSLGKGLVVIGGRNSYGLGGYRGTDLEALLPVESEVFDPKRKLSVAEVLAIDTSGSMAACHCNGDSASARSRGGVNKTDISRTAALRAIEALSPNDQVGVLVFDSRQRWAIPLQANPPRDLVTKQLRALSPDGSTSLDRPLLVAGDRLRAADAQLKHIVLFTDGFTSERELSEVRDQAAELFNSGITVSVLATGEAQPESLKAIADAGHGRFYPGTDIVAVPQIMAQETLLASRSFINEGRFVPTVVAAAAPVRSLVSAPPILGFVATTTKAAADTWLTVGPDDDPLLASWYPGLGRVTAWTADASDRWSQEWARWEGYPAFWAAVVKDAFPVGDGGSTLRIRAGDQRVRVELESETPWPDGSRATLRGTSPDGAPITPVILERRSPTAFAGEINGSQTGTYALAATVVGPTGASIGSSTGVSSRSYSAEYRPGPTDDAQLRRISAAGGGRGVVEASSVFDPAGLTAGSGSVSLTGWLLRAAALLFVLDAAMRRLVLSRTSLGAIAEAIRHPVRNRRRRRGERPMPPILGKLAAQRYARDRERAPAAPAERDATVLPDATVAPEAAGHAPEQGDAAVPGFLPPDAPGAPVTELRLPTSPRTPDNAR